ncbi:16S rRNA (guanine(527)-N(7))-methyltransferase RsmG [Ornithinimicrobium pratense]|uniref:Ribosomal RNA small subunit methyltransferase G n=1 Tax=Ornithinimicrobium pratense TaxID=2593973 RepID=A0A5J6V9M4_9MICO|nr:16S rRNA (guanine(527)-N(7))-methyltransferase RsmG [Ornithinimicrobium pratense]QFG70044.1 16S rRNA (guanine(527)-N(7))-methyltransferase RsmG [Ornithinimicrobium pratense]
MAQTRDGEAPGGRRTVPPPVSGAPEPPAEAADVFGDSLDLARRYADLLATTGISHGLVGPREAPRLWQRHLVNCALPEAMLDEGESVIDIGSGAGLPGLVLAIVRPDLRVHLVEPLLRRTTWLQSTVEALGLSNVTVHRGRAEEMSLLAPVATARAVASLDKLVAWSFPLLAPGGRLLALKGEAAEVELEQAHDLLHRMGVEQSAVHHLGVGRVSEPVRVVEIVRPAQWQASTPGTRRRVDRPRGSTKRGRPGSRSSH